MLTLLKNLIIIYVVLFVVAILVRRIVSGRKGKVSSSLSDAIILKGEVAMQIEESGAYPTLTDENGFEYRLEGNCLDELEKRGRQTVSLKGKILSVDHPDAPVVFYVMEIVED